MVLGQFVSVGIILLATAFECLVKWNTEKYENDKLHPWISIDIK